MRIVRIALPLVAFFVLLASSMTLLWADSCTATPLFDGDGNYAGCLTNVNGHEHFSNPQGLTRLGCNTFCAALRDITFVHARNAATGQSIGTIGPTLLYWPPVEMPMGPMAPGGMWERD